jgi:hypothetical protein
LTGCGRGSANVIDNWIQNSAGHHVNFDLLFQRAIVGSGGTIPSVEQFDAWMTRHHYSQWVSYQPNNWF